MKLVLSAAAALCLMPAAAFAQNAPAPAPAAAVAAAPAAAAAAPAPAAAPAAKFNLDTPIEVIVADPAAMAALTADFGGMDIRTNEHYEGFKSMSLNQIAGYAPDKLPPELLKKIETDLAAIK